LATMGKGAFLNKMGGAHVEGWNRYKWRKQLGLKLEIESLLFWMRTALGVN
jgi:hypothetical protein